MASKPARIAFAVLIICLVLLCSGDEVSGQRSSDCYFIEEKCKNHADCRRICSDHYYNFGAICVPTYTRSMHCCCIVEA
ncbi:hypothetical protein PTKIN_Ptkin13bG0119500 [Pterospermum kingtungense]